MHRPARTPPSPPCRQHHLWYYGVAQADEIVRAQNASALRLLPSGRRRMSPGCVCGCIRPPDLHLLAHTVAIRSLWQCIAHARSLAEVLGMAHLRQPVCFDSTVPRDLAQVGRVLALA